MYRKTKALAAASLLGAFFAAGAAKADALATPSLSGPLAANSAPMNFDAGPLGTVYVTGVFSALAITQSHHSSTPGDRQTLIDFSNAQVSVQKTDGWLQFYVQAGGYSIPALGAPYIRATTQTENSFGLLPVAYLKIAPLDSFNIEIGKLPTLIGAESTFTFQNMNIERGLLWNQTSAVSRSVQANYSAGPLSASLSLNDGYYSNRYNWLSGTLIYTISPADSVTFIGGGNIGHTDYGYPLNGPSIANPTPALQNSGSLYNLVWTHTEGPWTLSPNLQYSSVPQVASLHSGSTWGAGLFANYAFDASWSLASRLEYIAASGHSAAVELYGPGSKAFSITVTPTYQHKIFFARVEASYVDLEHGIAGAELGVLANKSAQARVLIETGVIF